MNHVSQILARLVALGLLVGMPAAYLFMVVGMPAVALVNTAQQDRPNQAISAGLDAAWEMSVRFTRGLTEFIFSPWW